MDTKLRHNGSSTMTVALPEPEHERARNIHEVVAGALLSITGIGYSSRSSRTKRYIRRFGTTARLLGRSGIAIIGFATYAMIEGCT
jgi:hypothetical protein